MTDTGEPGEAHEAPLQMVRLLAGFQISQALYCAAKLEVADRLADGPRTVDELAAETGADREALRRLLRSLAAIGVFTEPESDVFQRNALGAVLASDAPGSMRDLALMWMETHYAPFGELIDTIRTGANAATRHYGQPFFNWLGSNPEQVARFSSAMANLTDGIKRAAVSAYDFSGAGTIVDLGAADGALLAFVLANNPNVTGVAFDLPRVVAAAEATVVGYGLGERLTQTAGNFFDAVPTGGDTYVLSMVLHDWNDDDASLILSNISKAARPGTKVVAFELVVPAGNAPHMSKMIDLTMLGMLEGRERTDEEMRSIFERAGLTYDGSTGTPAPISIIEAHVPN